MRLIENRLVGENAFENAVLRNYAEEMLGCVYDVESLWSWGAGDTGEPGVMWVQADWCHGSLACEVWFEPEERSDELNAEALESGDFCLQLKWRTPEREGRWHEVNNVVQIRPLVRG